MTRKENGGRECTCGVSDLSHIQVGQGKTNFQMDPSSRKLIVKITFNF